MFFVQFADRESQLGAFWGFLFVGRYRVWACRIEIVFGNFFLLIEINLAGKYRHVIFYFGLVRVLGHFIMKISLSRG